MGQWDERRHLMSRIATRLALGLCKVRATDPMSGFFALDRGVFEEALPRLNPMGFKILLDLLVHVPASTPLTELPFTFGLRTQGESKLSRRVQIEFLEYLYDVAIGRYVPLTFAKYCLVGAAGVVVNLVGFYLAIMLLGERSASGFLGLKVPFLLGVESAIIFNFVVNNTLTFSLSRLRGAHAVVGFVTYNIACLLGTVANYSVAAYLFSQGISELTALAAGALIGMIWNYTMSLQFTWKGA